MRKSLIIWFVVISLLSVGAAMASTSADKQLAIDKGLAWLAAHQNANGSWSDNNSSAYNVADTGAALLAFTEQYYKPSSWNGVDYSGAVTKATNYLLSQAQTLNISSPNWWGFKGTNNSGMGIQWNYGGEETYISGIAVAGLARLVSNPYGGSPYLPANTVINSSNTAVNQQTYTQVIQKAVDSWVWGQSGPSTGNKYGGWRYFTNQMDSDMSTTQWPVMDFLFAKPVSGVTIPNGNVTIPLQAWIAACQTTSGPNKGGVSYQPGSSIGPNATHIGSFLLSNFFAGGGGSKDDAIAWLNAHWKEIANGTWNGNFGHPYAMFAVYKGLDAFYGTTGAGPITNLNAETTPIDPGATWNWWEDYCQSLVESQKADGSWNGYSYWTGALATSWDINILNATATTPEVIPLPGTLLLLGSGLAGLFGLGRKFRRS